MPYRAELKRPDLKGQFPCSVCGKIFCHSSSLSRHRMQAHFKSYTCNQCDQEISSNETLRSHMFRNHGISRMFMCRCCNWAFPDKTSLHIHMQSMIRNGHPGDVSVLARSSTEGPGIPFGMGSASPYDMDSPESSPTPRHQSVSPTAITTTTSAANNTTNGSIFPTMPKRDELLTRLRERAVANAEAANNGLSKSATATTTTTATKRKLSKCLPPNGIDHMTTNPWLANWLANNPIASSNPTIALATMQQQLLNGSMLNGNKSNSGCPLDDIDDDMDDDDDALEINTMDETDELLLDDEDVDCDTAAAFKVDPNCCESMLNQRPAPQQLSISGNPLNSLLYKKKLNNVLRNKRKTSKPRCLSSAKPAAIIDKSTNRRSISTGASPKSEQQNPPVPSATKQEQPSPTVSDSHTSGSSCAQLSAASDVSANSQQQQKCFECQVLKGKLGMAENRIKFSESKVSSLESKIARLDNQISGLEETLRQDEAVQRDQRQQCENFESKLLECQEKAVTALGHLHAGPDAIPTVKEMLENLLECTSLFRNGKL